MRTNFSAAALTAACLMPLIVRPAHAHVVVGDRVFPVTLTFDDPGVADEVTLPQFIYQPGESGSNQYQFQWEWDKTITPTTALIYNQGWDILTAPGAKTYRGLENAAVTGKWQSITIPASESVMSLGVIREFGGGYSTVNIGGDSTGATSPTIYVGQGFGALPIGLARPFAITGELNYNIPDRRLNSTGDNGGQPYSWTGGLSLQYSIPYLQGHVKHFDMPDFFSHLVLLVELTWFSPAGGPAPDTPMTLTVAPGVIYLGNKFQAGVEALIPANTAAGPHVGLIFQVHFFLDDIFPHSIGRPIFQ